MGWHGPTTLRQQVFGTVIDRVVWQVDIPVLVARVTTPVNGLERVILGLPQGVVSQLQAEQVLEVAVSIAGGLKAPLTVHAAPEYLRVAQELTAKNDTALAIDASALSRDLVSVVSGEDRPGPESLVIVPSAGSYSRIRRSLGTTADRLSRETEDTILVIHFP